MSKKSREITCKLLEMMDTGEIDPRTVANACLNAMSEDDVSEMAHSEEFLVYQDREEEEDV
jgi:glutamine synthetase